MRILVAVIAYNEARNIEATLRDLRDNNCGFDVVVIDNGSTDNTADLCRKMHVPVLSHCINTGGSAGTVWTYFSYAFRERYDVLCQFDGDGQHLATELPKIIAPIRAAKADYVIGSRFIEKVGFQSSRTRRIGIQFFALLNSWIMGQTLTDVTSGFRAYGRDVISFFANHYRHEIQDTNQLLLLSHFSGARVMEVPVKMQERAHGQSEFHFMKAVVFPLKGLINILGCLLQRHRVQKWKKVRDL